MTRKAKERRRIDQQRPRKLQIKASTSSNSPQRGNPLPVKFRKHLYKAAERCFKLVGYYCCKFCFAPLTVDNNGNYVVRQHRWGLRLHKCLLTLQFTWLLYQLVSLVIKGSAGVVDLEMVLCMTTFAVSIIGLSVSASVLFKRQETAELLNTFPTIMKYSYSTKKLGLFENFKSVLFVFGIAAVTSVIAIFASVLNFVLPSLPGSLYYIMDQIGIPQVFPGVSPVVWKLLIWPAEFFMSTQSMMLSAWSSLTLLMLPNIAISFSKDLRKIPLDTLSGWKELQWRYLIYQTWHSLGNSWVKFMIVPAIASICGAIVIALYITIRHTDLPLLLYICFPYVAFADLVIVFWINFEVTNVVGETEKIQQSLMVTARQSFLGLTSGQTQYLKKTARATRPATIDIGDLMDYNIDVLIGMWDEILNQLLFLLTL